MGTWRMPTQAEMLALVNTSSVWTTRNRVNGRYFGTSDEATANANPNNYVFLPAAGCRGYGSTAMFTIGTDGLYWSAMANGITAASYLYFHNVNTYNDTRNTGFSIRCVK